MDEVVREKKLTLEKTGLMATAARRRQMQGSEVVGEELSPCDDDWVTDFSDEVAEADYAQHWQMQPTSSSVTTERARQMGYIVLNLTNQLAPKLWDWSKLTYKVSRNL